MRFTTKKSMGTTAKCVRNNSGMVFQVWYAHQRMRFNYWWTYVCHAIGMQYSKTL